MLKILQVRLQQYVYQEFPDVQAEFRKDRGIRNQIANISMLDHRKHQENSRKTYTSATMLTPLCGSQQTVENS